ncbi:GNAT family N-acetyltransferase [Actinomadura sp. LOL_016]|uniref:GNAT family N-acetyltransferase n=1 Tax=unclassified Actinomadura TaxID=2626254 RepID=UPI003A8100AB
MRPGSPSLRWTAPRSRPSSTPSSRGLDAGTSRLVTAHLDGRLAGWLNLRRDPWALISHRGTLHHVQTRTAVRGRGVGAALVNEAVASAATSGQAPVSSPISPSIRVRISSRMGRTASTPRPAGSSSVQSR